MDASSLLWHTLEDKAPPPTDDPYHWKPFLYNTVFPIIGVILANVMALSPLPTFIELFQTREVEALDPFPIVVMFGSAINTFSYAVATKDKYLFTSNGPAVLIQSFCMLALMRAKDFGGRRAAWAIAIMETSMILLLANLGIQAIWQKPWGLQTMGVVFNVFQYAFFLFPLSQLRRIFLTRSARSLVPPLAFAVTINGALWFFYGLAIQDYFVAGPNAVATAVGIIQITCIFVFGRGEEKRGVGYDDEGGDDEDEEA